jgi:hypothetical protein
MAAGVVGAKIRHFAKMVPAHPIRNSYYMERNSMSRRVLITGDVVIDHFLYEAQQSLLGSSVRVGATSQRVPGAAGLLGNMLTALALPPDGPFEVVAGQAQDQADGTSVSFLVMQPCAVTKRNANNQVWRLTQPMGVERSAAARVADPSEKTNTVLNERHDIMVIDDANLGFRRWANRAAWPSCLRPESAEQAAANALPDWIILKSAAPLAAGNMWHTIISGETQHESEKEAPRQFRIGNLAERTILVTTIDDLRLEGLRVDGQLSWDGAAMDLVRELTQHPRLNELLRVRCLVVQFHLDGVLVFDNPRVDASPAATLLFDPGGTEGAFARQYPPQGRVLGCHTVFTAALVQRLASNSVAPDAPDAGHSIHQGVAAGLSAARRLLHHGHGAVSPGIDPGFPFSEVARETKSLEWKFGTVVLPSTPDSKWTIVGGSLPQPLWGLARQVARFGIEQLKTTSYLQLDKLFSIDRSEMESLRTLERLLTNYRNDRKATKPLSIAAFGQPGSGKSFGVKQLANSLFDDSVLLEFNLSQSTQIAAVEEKLNELGREGWEYSHTMHRAENFKRPLR